MEKEFQGNQRNLTISLPEDRSRVVLYHIESPGVYTKIVNYHFGSPWQS